MSALAYDAAIFDLDGTLVDTVADLAESLNRVLRRMRLPVHDHAAYRRMVGRGLRALASDALPPERRTEADVASCYEQLVADYRENCLVESRPYDGVAELLARLRAAGVRLAVFSNKDDELARRVVAGLFAPGTLDLVMGVGAGVPAKPDPAGAVLVAGRLGAAPARTVFVGDSGIDMQTATRAGMCAVGVSWGFRPAAELVENGASRVIDRPLELLDLCG